MSMSAVRRWSLFLRAVLVAIAILALGAGAYHAGIVENQRLALWPAFEILHVEKLEGPQPVSSLAEVAVVQVAIWTLLSFIAFVVLDSIRHGGSSRR